MTRQLYEEPVLIRAVAERRDTLKMHSELEMQSLNNPILSPKVNSNTVNIVRCWYGLYFGCYLNSVSCSPSWM